MADKARILLVEDDEVDQTTVVRALKEKFTIVLVETEETALNLIQNGEFYCVLLDFHIPNTDTKKLLDACVAAKLPVLMLGGYNPALIKSLAIEIGATDFLSKDELTERELIMKIESAVQSAHALDRLEEEEKAHLEKLNILLVDDDEVDILSIKRAFKRVNISNPLVVASNGREALDVLRGANGKTKLEHPYIVLLDLDMPIMNGLEFLDELRADQELKDTAVFVLTSSEDSANKRNALQKGTLAYLIKSQAGDDFLDQIKLIDFAFQP